MANVPYYYGILTGDRHPFAAAKGVLRPDVIDLPSL
ncbi:hypothetical protein AGR7C_Lc220031 [Agrobacterium deltaense Zutra 3/1]|uniref:Uncharacterized protein n=1 Tax=Agrobacterium deltaense Zutra 3/1 TaxID=1183427 RepID=A0A1S7RRE2_9HYPH|nr:hypothetical protein AGR7C_Lc220031 [Agrobacterium deltaense Zutra 3/1]